MILYALPISHLGPQTRAELNYNRADYREEICGENASLLSFAGKKFGHAFGELWISTESLSPSLVGNVLFERLNNRLSSPHVAAALRSQAFFQALDDCFPKDVQKQNSYLQSMYVSDLLGTGVATGVVVLPFYLTKYVALRILSAMSRGAALALPIAKRIAVYFVTRLGIAYTPTFAVWWFDLFRFLPHLKIPSHVNLADEVEDSLDPQTFSKMFIPQTTVGKCTIENVWVEKDNVKIRIEILNRFYQNQFLTATVEPKSENAKVVLRSDSPVVDFNLPTVLGPIKIRINSGTSNLESLEGTGEELETGRSVKFNCQ